jgi:hypothetical protein
LLSTNLDLLYDRLDDEKRKKMIRELREQARLLNGLVVSALEMLRERMADPRPRVRSIARSATVGRPLEADRPPLHHSG